MRSLVPTSARFAPLAQLDRASDFESEGRRFESYGVRQFTARSGGRWRHRPDAVELALADGIQKAARFLPDERLTATALDTMVALTPELEARRRGREGIVDLSIARARRGGA